MNRTLTIVGVVVAMLAATTIGYAASFSLSTTHLGASAVTVPPFFPVSVTIANKSGGTLHKPENGDIITLVYSDLIQASTLCSSWTNSGPNNAVSLQWAIVNGVGGANDTLVANGTAAACSGGLKVGTIDLGATGYNNGTSDINYVTTSTTISFGTSTTTVTATLNGQAKGATPGTVSSGSAATWTPNTAVTDRLGNNCGSNLAKSASTLQF